MRIYISILIGICLLATSSRSAAEALRVCADPDYMPFSNRAGDGFENKIAELTAKVLGDRLDYEWFSYRAVGGFGEFLSRTLDARKCDLVVSIPYGNQEELTTDPYYASSYVFVFKKAKNFDLQSMDSSVLRQVKIGFERGTPPEEGLKLRDLLLNSESFEVGDRDGVSPESMLRAVEDGKVDVMITWEPAVGWFLRNYPDLAIVRVPNGRTMGSPEQYMFSMSMGVRKDNEALKARLDNMLGGHKPEIQAILSHYNVRLYGSANDTP